MNDQIVQVAGLYQRKQATYSENKIYPGIQIHDLRPELIERCRRYVRINRDNHPWADMDDLQLLKSAQLYFKYRYLPWHLKCVRWRVMIIVE